MVEERWTVSPMSSYFDKVLVMVLMQRLTAQTEEHLSDGQAGLGRQKYKVKVR